MSNESPGMTSKQRHDAGNRIGLSTAARRLHPDDELTHSVRRAASGVVPIEDALGPV